jgi:hypothetical protein
VPAIAAVNLECRPAPAGSSSLSRETPTCEKCQAEHGPQRQSLYENSDGVRLMLSLQLQSRQTCGRRMERDLHGFVSCKQELGGSPLSILGGAAGLPGGALTYHCESRAVALLGAAAFPANGT